MPQAPVNRARARGSRTAELVAVSRARHLLRHDKPWVFEDLHAIHFVGNRWRRVLESRLVDALFSKILVPGLIVQGDWLSTAQSRTVVILPLTSDVRRDAEPLRVTIAARGGLRTVSQIVVDQPRTLDRRRLGEGPLTELSESEMARVEESLVAVLGVLVT